MGQSARVDSPTSDTTTALASVDGKSHRVLSVIPIMGGPNRAETYNSLVIRCDQRPCQGSSRATITPFLSLLLAVGSAWP
jgi:hypothetical protein